MSKSKQPIVINSRKIDGSIHRTWKADFVEQQNSLLTFVGRFDDEIIHSELGIIRRGTISYEYYWLDRWFNVFRFHEPEGELRNFYCNLNQPPKFEKNVLDYVDLEIDVVVSKDYEIEVLDLDEFEENSRMFNYSEELINKTLATLEELLVLIKSREFPFRTF
jgi:protein associated with RNAse G/E